MVVGDAGAEESLQCSASPAPAQSLGGGPSTAGGGSGVVSQRAWVSSDAGHEALQVRVARSGVLEERYQGRSGQRKEILYQCNEALATSSIAGVTRNEKAASAFTQAEVCYTCHKEQRAQYQRPSRHPILEGKVSCSDCHNPHGSIGPKLMKRDSVVDTCFQCHMEKRGPFVRPHEPVTEDCSNCHAPHGTTVENMLKARLRRTIAEDLVRGA